MPRTAHLLGSCAGPVHLYPSPFLTHKSSIEPNNNGCNNKWGFLWFVSCVPGGNECLRERLNSGTCMHAWRTHCCCRCTQARGTSRCHCANQLHNGGMHATTVAATDPVRKQSTLGVPAGGGRGGRIYVCHATRTWQKLAPHPRPLYCKCPDSTGVLPVCML